MCLCSLEEAKSEGQLLEVAAQDQRQGKAERDCPTANMLAHHPPPPVQRDIHRPPQSRTELLLSRIVSLDTILNSTVNE